jgi:hypothetical protein
LGGRLTAHQGDDGEGPALHLHFGHYLIRRHLGDQTHEPVASGARNAEGIGRGRGVFAGELGEDIAGDDFAPRLVFMRHQAAAIDPPAHRVIADSEQHRGIFDPNGRHAASLLCPSHSAYAAETA